MLKTGKLHRLHRLLRSFVRLPLFKILTTFFASNIFLQNIHLSRKCKWKNLPRKCKWLRHSLCYPLLGIVRGFSKQCCYFKVFVIIINNNINRYDQYLMKVNVYFTYCDMSKHTINTMQKIVKKLSIKYIS